MPAGDFSRHFSHFRFKVAEGPEARRAIELRATIYATERGNPGTDARDSSAIHLVALSDTGEVVAAMRVIPNDQRPFDLEDSFDLATLVPPVGTSCEVSRFVVGADSRRVVPGYVVHLGMLKLLFEYAESRGITDVLSLGLPHLIGIYKAAFFDVVSGPKTHELWGSAYLMRMQPASVRERCAGAASTLARLLMSKTPGNVMV